jgi:hypothetical protein
MPLRLCLPRNLPLWKLPHCNSQRSVVGVLEVKVAMVSLEVDLKKLPKEMPANNIQVNKHNTDKTRARCHK